MTILETGRLFLRPLQPSDADALFQLHCDPLVVRLTTHGQPMTRVQSDERLDLYLREERDFGLTFFAVFEKQPNGDLLFAGRCGLRSFKYDAVEIGYCFSERASGRGLATESACLIVADAFGRLDRRKLVGLVRPTNQQSQRVLKKLGFTQNGMTFYRDVDYLCFERNKGDSAYI
ncbi:Protein N-acetyltransferase, RimJ/RimL family [Mesorhizobium escarrei]|uniref:Protein N-acetyltransferase, RimJ/RimL family n=1 Tax=Mesorhizobium escarrei TaxID=666018 RepID=A0ABM9EA26_9HYPH|nr:GNAT family N-acetyltransferase [Mesorhizobium escarrei]CAH2406256.1 Protein N-acetyltransferase, RimJ/RimL family [Mesorhizobium escarrei]